MNASPSSLSIVGLSEYLLSRLTTHFGAKPNYFNTFIDAHFLPQKWFDIEAYYALTRPVAKTRLTVSRSETQSIIHIQYETDNYELRLLPIIHGANSPLSDQMIADVSHAFDWIRTTKNNSILYMLEFPSDLANEERKDEINQRNAENQTELIREMQFVIPNPPRTMIKANASVFIHNSQIPITPGTST